MLGNKDILLTVLNSTYQHAALGLRYLFANLEELQPQAQIIEFTIEKYPRDIVENIISTRPKIVGFGVYIWNVRQTLEVIQILKRVAPEVKVVIGGPEVSHESETQEICQLADHTIKGEADFLFRDLCRSLLTEGSSQKFISGPLPDIQRIKSPYPFYNQEDIANRVIYVEASRGCPFRCEYCLSSLDKLVRNFPLESLLADFDDLIDRGVRQFKFLDRTFNLNIQIGIKILEFFLARMDKGLFLHFEMIPDRLPVELRSLLVQFPKGSLQFEIGIQTLNPMVSQLISRKNDMAKVEDNFKFLATETGVHTHADLIAGLPGETLESFAVGFDRLLSLGPDEIQLGILKRLKGTPIVRHDREWQMTYQESPPYLILSTKTMSFNELQKMNRMSRFWDLIKNSGQFPNFISALGSWRSNEVNQNSMFYKFWNLTDYLTVRHQQSHSIHLANLAESLFEFLKKEVKMSPESAAAVIFGDYCRDGKRTLPGFLKPFITGYEYRPKARQSEKIPERQKRHLEVQ